MYILAQQTWKKVGMDGSGGLHRGGTPGVSPSHHHPNDVFSPLRVGQMSNSQPSISIPSFQVG